MTDQQTSLKPLHPTLYQLAQDGTSLDFFFAQCPACGAVNFPANAPGCSHCGAFGPIENSELNTRLIGGDGHCTAQSINFINKMTFTNTTDGRVA